MCVADNLADEGGVSRVEEGGGWKMENGTPPSPRAPHHNLQPKTHNPRPHPRTCRAEAQRRHQRMREAMRRFSPCTNIAWAMKKLPRKRKMMGSAKLAKICLADPIPATTQSAGPISAVTGRGTASVIHNVTTNPSTARRRWAFSSRPVMGENHSARKMSGARTNPDFCRRFSNRCSCSERTPCSLGPRCDMR
jgi:hypothetical protein